MDIKILRGASDKVIFVECSGQFVDVLMNLMHAPLGGVLAAVARDPYASDQALPGSALCASLGKLSKQENLFVTTPEPTEETDLSEFLKLKPAQKVSLLKSHLCSATQRGNSLEITGQGQAWQMNAFVKVPDQHNFTIRVSSTSGNRGPLNMMLGVVPVTGNVDVRKNNLYQLGVGKFLHCTGNGHLYYAACTAEIGVGCDGETLMRVSKVDNRMTLEYASSNRHFVRTDNWCNIALDDYIPVVCVSQGNPVLVELVPELNSVQMPATIKPEVQFLVNNGMEVFQSTSTLAIGLIAKHNSDSLKGIRSETRRVDSAALRRMILGFLLGRDDVLDFAFPPESSPSLDETTASSESSESSFQLMSMSDSTCEKIGKRKNQKK